MIDFVKKEVDTGIEDLDGLKVSYSDRNSRSTLSLYDREPNGLNMSVFNRVVDEYVKDKIESVHVKFRIYDEEDTLLVENANVVIDGEEKHAWIDRGDFVTKNMRDYIEEEYEYNIVDTDINLGEKEEEKSWLDFFR